MVYIQTTAELMLQYTYVGAKRIKFVILTQNTPRYIWPEKIIITLIFYQNAIFFLENWQKISENSDHKIVTVTGPAP
jgi:hypothetical protein